MLNGKRHVESSAEDVDGSIPSKRLRSSNSNDATSCRKIADIVAREFDREIEEKTKEFECIDERINTVRQMMDRLRAYQVMKEYQSTTILIDKPTRYDSSTLSDPGICLHPTVRRLLSKVRAPSTMRLSTQMSVKKDPDDIIDVSVEHCQKPLKTVMLDSSLLTSSSLSFPLRASPSHHRRGDFISQYRKFVVGNTSRYIGLSKNPTRSSTGRASDQLTGVNNPTHKWVVYIRSTNEDPQFIENHVQSVVFSLDDSYKPDDVVEICKPPFQLVREGWGEFPIRLEIAFRPPFKKLLKLVHHLKLDRSFTGQTLKGAEKVIEVELNLLTGREFTSKTANDSLNDVVQLMRSTYELPLSLPSLSLPSSSSSPSPAPSVGFASSFSGSFSPFLVLSSACVVLSAPFSPLSPSLPPLPALPDFVYQSLLTTTVSSSSLSIASPLPILSPSISLNNTSLLSSSSSSLSASLLSSSLSLSFSSLSSPSLSSLSSPSLSSVSCSSRSVLLNLPHSSFSTPLLMLKNTFSTSSSDIPVKAVWTNSVLPSSSYSHHLISSQLSSPSSSYSLLSSSQLSSPSSFLQIVSSSPSLMRLSSSVVVSSSSFPLLLSSCSPSSLSSTLSLTLNNATRVVSSFQTQKSSSVLISSSPESIGEKKILTFRKIATIPSNVQSPASVSSKILSLTFPKAAVASIALPAVSKTLGVSTSSGIAISMKTSHPATPVKFVKIKEGNSISSAVDLNKIMSNVSSSSNIRLLLPLQQHQRLQKPLPCLQQPLRQQFQQPLQCLQPSLQHLKLSLQQQSQQPVLSLQLKQRTWNASSLSLPAEQQVIRINSSQFSSHSSSICVSLSSPAQKSSASLIKSPPVLFLSPTPKLQLTSSSSSSSSSSSLPKQLIIFSKGLTSGTTLLHQSSSSLLVPGQSPLSLLRPTLPRPSPAMMALPESRMQLLKKKQTLTPTFRLPPSLKTQLAKLTGGVSLLKPPSQLFAERSRSIQQSTRQHSVPTSDFPSSLGRQPPEGKWCCQRSLLRHPLTTGSTSIQHSLLPAPLSQTFSRQSEEAVARVRGILRRIMSSSSSSSKNQELALQLICKYSNELEISCRHLGGDTSRTEKLKRSFGTGKRRANELYEAVKIMEVLKRLMAKPGVDHDYICKSSSMTGNSGGSTVEDARHLSKWQIIKWRRDRGLVPLDAEMMKSEEKKRSSSLRSSRPGHSKSDNFYTTASSVERLVERLEFTMDEQRQQPYGEDEDVDVVGVEPVQLYRSPFKSQAGCVVVERKSGEAVLQDSFINVLEILPLSTEGKLTQLAMSQVGLLLKPSIISPENSRCIVVGYLVEEMLAQALRSFFFDLTTSAYSLKLKRYRAGEDMGIHDNGCLIDGRRRSYSEVAERFEVLKFVDIFELLKRDLTFDFLTNAHLGVTGHDDDDDAAAAADIKY